jgi:hypothetical protein
MSTKVEDLARISLRPGAIHIDVEDRLAASTVDTLSQGYVVCPSDRRFLLLFTFLKKNMKKKVIVFFSSCNSVKYHSELLNYIDVPVLDLHVRFSRHPCPPRDTISDLWISRESRNNKSALPHSSSFAMPTTAHSFVPMWPPEDLISPQLIGSYSLTHRMILETTFIEWAEQLAPEKLGRACCSCWRASLASCDI